jgi:hypothetical protein
MTALHRVIVRDDAAYIAFLSPDFVLNSAACRKVIKRELDIKTPFIH